MIWAAVAGLLVAWFVGLLLIQAPVVNLLLIAATVLLAAQLINERETTA